MMYLLTAIGFPPGGSNTVHIYTQTIHRTNIDCNIIKPTARWQRHTRLRFVFRDFVVGKVAVEQGFVRVDLLRLPC
jgi:hypothetical protein